jgi:hypothetical protein
MYPMGIEKLVALNQLELQREMVRRERFAGMEPEDAGEGALRRLVNRCAAIIGKVASGRSNKLGRECESQPS